MMLALAGCFSVRMFTFTDGFDYSLAIFCGEHFRIVKVNLPQEDICAKSNGQKHLHFSMHFASLQAGYRF